MGPDWSRDCWADDSVENNKSKNKGERYGFIFCCKAKEAGEESLYSEDYFWVKEGEWKDEVFDLRPSMC